MSKCDFNIRHDCSPANLLHIFRAPPRNTSGWLLLNFTKNEILNSHFSRILPILGRFHELNLKQIVFISA